MRRGSMTPVNLLNYTAAIDRVDGPDAARGERVDGERRWPSDENSACFRPEGLLAIRVPID
jgi:hypothetical protein